MRRGFKAEAERTAERVRGELKLGAVAPLDSRELARHLGLEVRSAADLVAMHKLEALEALQPGAFSACTFELPARKVVVWNPLATPARTQSDIAHESSHVILEHSVQQLERIGDFTFLSCDPDEEQEANWLAGCLLLPRSLLVKVVRATPNPDELAERFGVSREMVNFRLRATGVLRQYGRS